MENTGFTLNGITYATTTTGTAVVLSTTNTGDLVIPSSIDYNNKTYSVTEIAASAFTGNKDISSITLPASVNTIGNSAFNNCSGLTAVYTPSLTDWLNINFANSSANPLYCAKNLYVNNTLLSGNISLPTTTSKVNSYAFYNCANITGVKIPNSVTSLGSSVFYGCTQLVSAEVGNGITSFSGTFGSCTSLKTVTLPNTLKTIGSSAFDGCTNLSSITIPSSVTTIDYYAFRNCSSLTSVIIPDSVTSLGQSVFNGCTNLVSAKLGNSITRIEYGVFYDCTNLTSVNIPGSVTSLSDIFKNCSSLTTVTFESGIKRLSGSIFGSGCTALTHIILPDTITELGYYVFFHLSNLKSLYIPSSVTTVSASSTYGQFYGCSSTLKVYCGASSKPSGWNSYWTLCDFNGGRVTALWGYTLEQYKAAEGLN